MPSLIPWIVIYLLDNIICPLYNWVLINKTDNSQLLQTVVSIFQILQHLLGVQNWGNSGASKMSVERGIISLSLQQNNSPGITGNSSCLQWTSTGRVNLTLLSYCNFLKSSNYLGWVDFMFVTLAWRQDVERGRKLSLPTGVMLIRNSKTLNLTK